MLAGLVDPKRGGTTKAPDEAEGDGDEDGMRM